VRFAFGWSRFGCLPGGPDAHPVDLGFLGPCVALRKPPPLDSLGFPWILSSESRFFNGLRGSKRGVEPRFNVPDRSSKLDPYADKLSHMLRQAAGKSRKQKRTIKQLHADLVVLGYEGSYNRVAAFARDWRAARQREQKTAGRGVFVPPAFMAGEAFHSIGRKIGGSSRRAHQIAGRPLQAFLQPRLHSPRLSLALSRPMRCCSTPRIMPS
jgi:hypothetical protein